MQYDPKSVEAKWQAHWEEHQTFRTNDSDKPTYYVLDMFPYPSSDGLHVGHPLGYTATDIIARYKRAKGFEVLHPMGWDAFGLPAEQHAIKTGIHPRLTTEKAMRNFKAQLKRLGLSFDWSRELCTADPSYYQWTQKLFLLLFDKGLAVQREVAVNWCPELGTVLANEEVVNGLSERGKHPVYRVPMKQWMLRITEYAERLLDGLEKLDWPESTKELQRNWIGKSVGTKIYFALTNSESIEVFTTRADTIFGVTYLVLAPEHPLLSNAPEVKDYQREASKKSEIARQDTDRPKTGVRTNLIAIHPFTAQKLPVYTSDYVLAHYGSGALMGVPAHDDRDAEFAIAMQLPSIQVLENDMCIHSDFLNGLSSCDAQKLVQQKLTAARQGEACIQYKLRDWLFSRQRYWGEPIPLLTWNGVTIPSDTLPVTLPDIEAYLPIDGKSPLASAHDWVQTPKGTRETDTMPGSAGSSWYFLRFCDPHNTGAPFSFEAQKKWMPVDLYVGGQEHAVGHLLYARFWTKVFFDAGLLSIDEPFQKLVHQGMILGEDGEKMSKSRGNVINPDAVIDRFGADSLRLYEMFMGPLEREKPWSTDAIEGVSRFLHRAWRLCLQLDDTGDLDDRKMTHTTIKKVTEDIENLRFNTAISQLMVFVNFRTKRGTFPHCCIKPFIQLLAPFAPHIAEELWERIGESNLSTAPWPTFDENLILRSQCIAVQIMGKTRITLEITENATQEEIIHEARNHPSVLSRISIDTPIKKTIYVPGRIVNFVV